MHPKILGIGLPRTATTSLAKALGMLGFHTIHYPKTIDEIYQYDAATEVIFHISELRQKFPNAKFILTVRDKEDWLRSCRNHIKNWQNGWNPFWDSPEKWEQVYDTRIKEASGLDNILVMDICSGDGWEKLCPFLNVSDSFAFPHIKKRNEYV